MVRGGGGGGGVVVVVFYVPTVCLQYCSTDLLYCCTCADVQ